MMFQDNEVVAVLDWEMAAVAPPEVDLGWMCYLHLFFQDLAVDLGAPGLPGHVPPGRRGRRPTPRPPGHAPGDLTWHIAYAAMRHGAIMRRVTERSIFFGEAERARRHRRPDHPPGHAPGHAGRHLLGGRRPLTGPVRAGRTSCSRRLPERGVGASAPAPGTLRTIIGWQLPQPSAPVSEIPDVDHGVTDLVQLPDQHRVPAVGQALPVDVELAPPLAVVVSLPAEVEPGPQVEPGVAGDLQLEPADGAVLQGHRPPAAQQPAVGRIERQVGPDVGHPVDPAVDVLDRPGHRAVLVTEAAACRPGA